MKLNELTIGEAKQLATLFCSTENQKHPLDGKKVIAVLPHGFIHFGDLEDLGNSFVLRNASNLRYWEKRDGGLPEFAKDGPKSNDRIDKIGNDGVYFSSALFFYLIGDWDA